MAAEAKSFKVVLLGEGAVGKTSLVRKFVEGAFSDEYITTIGVNVKKKVMGPTTLMIWDIYGQKSRPELHMANYRGAAGALLVYDSTRKTTFDNLDNWLADLFKVTGEIPVVVLGNKHDIIRDFERDAGVEVASSLPGRFHEHMLERHRGVVEAYVKLYGIEPSFEPVSLAHLVKWAGMGRNSRGLKFPYFATSAKTGENVEAAFVELVNQLGGSVDG
ncbi:MAG: Rab family GTPase [Methanobacteriota archaeon]